MTTRLGVALLLLLAGIALRGQVVVRLVVTTITTPTSATTYNAGTSTSIAMSGTAAGTGITSCTWTNSLGGSGTATGTTIWSIPAVPLGNGTNLVTVTCVASTGARGVDTLSITATSAGTTFYVATNGLDSRSCTQAQTVTTPKRSIVNAATCLTPGATLLVRAGSYNENLVNAVPSGTSWANAVRVAAFPSETVTLAPTTGDFGIYFDGSPSYIEFDGINIDGTLVGSSPVFLDERQGGPPNHIRLKNADIHHNEGTNGGGGAVISGGNDNEFLNLTVHGTGGPYGFYISGNTNLIDGCNVYGTATAGVHIYSTTQTPTGNIVRNTRIHDITQSWFFGVPDARLWGILVSGANNQIYNNLIYNIDFPYQSSNAGIYVYTGSGHQLYNNTITANTTDGIYILGGVTTTTVVNNILYNNTGVAFDDRGTSTTALTNLSGTDPLFVSPSTFDFRLTSGSPAINTGTTNTVATTDFAGTARPQGTAYDIGAYEGSVASLATPCSDAATAGTAIYAKVSASGSGTGADWTNARALPDTTSFVRNRTYCIAGGTYTAKTPSTANNGTQVIHIVKATVADHGTAAGWSDTFGTTQATFPEIEFGSGYWDINGNTGGGPGSWDTGFGIMVDVPNSGGQTHAFGFTVSNPTNILLQHLDINGRGRTYGGGDTDLFYIINGVTNLTLSYTYLHDTDRTMILSWPSGTNGTTIEYSLFARNGTAEHREAWSYSTDSNVTIRYSLFEDICGTGFIAGVNGTGTASNWNVYGNAFYWTADQAPGIINTGIIVAGNGAPSFAIAVNNWHVYNNVFANIRGGSFTASLDFEVSPVNIVVENNIWYNNIASAGAGQATTRDYNWYYANGGNGTSGSNDVVGTANPFSTSTPWSTRNWALRQAISGLSLASPYNRDYLGVLRGGDGVFDRGVLEFP